MTEDLAKEHLLCKTSTQETIKLQNIYPRNDYATKHLPKKRLCYETSAQGTIMLQNIYPRNDYATKHLPKEHLRDTTATQGTIHNIYPRNITVESSVKETLRMQNIYTITSWYRKSPNNMYYCMCNSAYSIKHRRRIYTEAKATVVASVWEAEFMKFLAALAILPRLGRKG